MEEAFVLQELEALAGRPDIALWVNVIQVGPEEEALVFQNGTLIDRLRAGTYLYWKSTSFACRKVSLKELVADIAGQEIMTQDKVTLRLNLSVGYQVVDPVKAVSTVDDYAQAFYREAQLALRAAVAGWTVRAESFDSFPAPGDTLKVFDTLIARKP